MDPIYVQGLLEAKALLDGGVLSEEEYSFVKAAHVRRRDERKVAAQGGEKGDEDVKARIADVKARVAGDAAAAPAPGDDDDNDEAELSAYLSGSSPTLVGFPAPPQSCASVTSQASTLDLDDDLVDVSSGVRAVTIMLARLDTPTCADPQDVPTGEGKDANEAAKDWHAGSRHNALAELRAVSEKDGASLPTIRATLQSHMVEDKNLARIHSGAIITAIQSHDDTNFRDLSGCAGHLLEVGGSLFIALSDRKSVV